MSREHLYNLFSLFSSPFVTLPIVYDLTSAPVVSTGRTRRKSCVSCMESKIKCDRQFPCAKCLSRGKECVFTNATKSKPVSAQPASPAIARTEPSSGHQSSPGSLTLAVPVLSGFNMTPGMNKSLNQNMTNFSTQKHRLEAIHVADTSSVDGGKYVPSRYGTSDASFDCAPYTASDVENTTDADQLMPAYSRFTSIYSSDIFEPLFSNLFSQHVSSSVVALPEDIPWSSDPRSGSPEDFPFATQPLYKIPGDASALPALPTSPGIQPIVSDIRSLSLDGNIVGKEPAELELQHYSKRLSFRLFR
jgi:hypothetical protein